MPWLAVKDTRISVRSLASFCARSEGSLRAGIRPYPVCRDPTATMGLNAGCDARCSVGVFPQTTLAITRSALEGNAQEAARLCGELAPLWEMFGRYGSLRVTRLPP